MNLFACIATLGMRMEPVLTPMETLLDDEALCQAVKADLVKRCPATATDGRPSTPGEGMRRRLVSKPREGWSCPQTAPAGSDRLVRRQFCRVSVAPVPAQRPWHRWAKRLPPATWHRLLAPRGHLACPRKSTPGRTRRLAGTVVATTLHHPTDSPRLSAGVRVLRRGLGKTTTRRRESAVVPPEATTHCAPQVRDQMPQLMAVARQRGEVAAERRKTTSRALIDLTPTVGARAKYAPELGSAQTPAASPRGAGTRVRCLPRVAPGSTQTPRRVLQGEPVPANEQIVSLFAPDTALRRQGKPGTPTACGRVLWLDEVEGGRSSRDAGLDGTPEENAPLPLRLDQHCQQCGRPPPLLPGARGRQSAAKARDAQQQGVPEVVLPPPGKQSAKRLTSERQAWCRAGRNWRAGIEGRSSGLQRRHTLDRGRYPGTAGMERWVGLGVMAHALHGIARSLPACPRPPAA